MKPTVSDSMAAHPDGRCTDRIVVSSVANSLSSEPTWRPAPRYCCVGEAQTRDQAPTTSGCCIYCPMSEALPMLGCLRPTKEQPVACKGTADGMQEFEPQTAQR